MKGAKRQQAAQTPDWLDQLVEEIYARKEAGELPSLSFLLESLLNEIMRRERDRFLRLNQGEQANGFYQRNLHLTLGKLSLKVPRVRYGKTFRPAILPPRWKRADKDYEELLIAMLANGYSQAQMERALKALDLPFSKDALQDAMTLIEDQLDFYKTQPLKGDWFAIFIDAYWAKLRTSEGKLQEISLFVAVGVDLEGNKEVLGFWVHRGRERKGLWVEVFQDLVNRGVHRVLVFVTDDFKGIHEVIEKLFPYADHQLCHLHLRRNLKRELSQEAYKEAGALLSKLRRADDQEEGKELFGRLCEVVRREKPKLAQLLSAKSDRYLAFLGYPEEVRKHVYTTNVVESINAGIEQMRLELGGYFPSQRCLEVNLFIQIVNLQDKWWKKPLPTVRSVSYQLCQLFTLRYELEEEAEVLHNF
jgi:transposase-like protein